MTDWATHFTANFATELQRDGLSTEQIARLCWRPTPVGELKLYGEDRDTDLSRLEISAADIQHLIDTQSTGDDIDRDFYRQQKVILVLLPGFTHETLKNLSWHDQMERKDSPHHILMLHPGEDGGPSREQVYNEADGLKVVYVRYPRSNASSEFINKPLFELLHNSPSLRRWVTEEGYKLCFVGYSYGSPLSLELLASLNTGQHQDDFLLDNTLGFLALCGDVGGSYLADDLLKDDAKLVNIHKVIKLARRYPLFAKLVGLGTEQLLNDMEGGIRSVGHPVRQAHMAEYVPQLPSHVKYFSIAAVMPMEDYRRRLWHFNLDDFSMYLQAKVTAPLTIYNDGQVTLDDNLIPDAPQVPEANRIHLGAVRTHHWGVAYRTFNFGRNRFPRPAFYRALMRTMHAAGVRTTD